jgi:hypothetical protein
LFFVELDLTDVKSIKGAAVVGAALSSSAVEV